MKPHEITFSTNILTLVIGVLLLTFLLNCTSRYLTSLRKRQPRSRLRILRNLSCSESREGTSEASPANARWYPTGWYWSDEMQLWLPPRYMEKKENIQA